MGSFLARLYAVSYPETVNAVVIHGTGGKNPAAPAGKLLVSLLRALFGSKHSSKFVTGVAFWSLNSHYDKSEGANAWLTRDGAAVATRDTDPYTSYIFTHAGYSIQ
jgi:alpha-beta hydrolase superfamily lysophospholipase